MLRNYYQHQARINANNERLPNNVNESYIKGFEEGFELALKSMEGLVLEKNVDVQIWKDTWTNILTDDSEWDY